MKLGPVELPALPVPRLGLAAFRRRMVVHLAFALLVAATLGLALTVLQDQKQRSYQRYEQGFRQSLAEITLQLRHPAGQLALLNPGMGPGDGQGLTPVLLPFSAIDFDDQYKALRAVEMAGCGLRWPSGASLCAAVGSNAYAGGFVYLVGSLDAGPLQARQIGQLALEGVHRLRVSLDYRGQHAAWVAPYEAGRPDEGAAQQRGRLTGFLAEGDQLERQSRPQREFRGWLWREGPCARPGDDEARCARHTVFSVRLPVEAFKTALFERGAQAWPPRDLDQLRLRVQLLGPVDDGTAAALLFDSALPGAAVALSLDRLGAGLQPGETLRIERLGARALVIAERRGAELGDAPLPWLSRLIRRLPVEAPVGDAQLRLQAQEEVITATGRYRLSLQGDLRSLDRQLAREARSLLWLVGAMLAAIAFAWLLVELGLIRRITVLTRRAAAVSYNMQDPRAEQRIGELDVADLKGRDELGILAGTLQALLQRVKDGLRREQLRAEREREMWHAVGHEIMSPLQSLMVLHGGADDPSHRYVQRMQQAVRVLYGTASPSEALEAADLQLETLDLAQFCREVVANAPHAGIEGVVLQGDTGAALPVRGEAYALEDVVTHVLRNAQRYRQPGTPITLTLSAEDGFALLGIHNEGPAIPPEMLARIFEYGVSDQPPDAGPERRGQGLFVARSYLAKMDAQIEARNEDGGVRFWLRLRRA